MTILVSELSDDNLNSRLHKSWQDFCFLCAKQLCDVKEVLRGEATLCEVSLNWRLLLLPALE